MTVRCLRITVELVVDHGEGLVPDRRRDDVRLRGLQPFTHVIHERIELARPTRAHEKKAPV